MRAMRSGSGGRIRQWPTFREAAPEGNGCAEGFIRTPRENLLRIRWFDTIEDFDRLPWTSNANPTYGC